MKRMIPCILLLSFAVGCAGPGYTGQAIQEPVATEVVIINDRATRAGFQQTMESWLSRNGYPYVVVPEGSGFDPEKLNLEYVGHWKWDVALYLSSARISALSKGQRVGEVDFTSPNTLNPNKFGSAEERIGHMMDVLFGKITIDEANALLTKQTGDQKN